MNKVENFEVVAVEAVFFFRITDVTNGVSDRLFNVNTALRRYLAHNENVLRRYSRFAGATRVFIVAEKRVKHAVRNSVTDLIGMTFRHRFRRKKSCCHFVFSFFKLLFLNSPE